MKTPTVLGLAVLLAMAPAGLMAQALNSGGGIKFLKNTDKADGFKKALPTNPCHTFSPAGDLMFCLEGTEWQLDGFRQYGAPTLYRLNETQSAAFQVIPLDQGASTLMDPDAVDELVEKRVFEDGPRGRRRLDRLVSAQRTPEGRLYSMKAYAQEADGSLVLLQLHVSFLEYGIGISETTTVVRNVPRDFRLSDEQIAFDTAFLKTIRTTNNNQEPGE